MASPATLTHTQRREIFLQALKNASVELDDSDLGLVAEIATRLAQVPETSRRRRPQSSPTRRPNGSTPPAAGGPSSLIPTPKEVTR